MSGHSQTSMLPSSPPSASRRPSLLKDMPLIGPMPLVCCLNSPAAAAGGKLCRSESERCDHKGRGRCGWQAPGAAKARPAGRLLVADPPCARLSLGGSPLLLVCRSTRSRPPTLMPQTRARPEGCSIRRYPASFPVFSFATSSDCTPSRQLSTDTLRGARTQGAHDSGCVVPAARWHPPPLPPPSPPARRSLTCSRCRAHRRRTGTHILQAAMRCRRWGSHT